MSFFAMILRSLVRQRIRTGLTLLGISVGITTVVALGAITGGFGQTAGQIIHTGGADFVVVQKGAADLSFSTVSEADWRSVKADPGVGLAIGEMMHVTQVGGNPMFFAMGVRPDQLRLLKPDLVSGQALANDPPLLLADEPTRSLDSKAGADILRLLETIRAQRDITVVMVTHDMTVAGHAGRTIQMLDGTLAADAAVTVRAADQEAATR